jgi:ubiquinone/menaquinone biosynthesis C-methylase UbiE
MTQKAHEQSRAVWDRMAPGWDRYRDYMWATTRHVAEWLLEHAEAREGKVILDVAGGPGELGFLAAERVGPSGRVIETDFAAQMVEVAGRRAEELELANLETRQLDAERMDLDDDSVDGIVCRWGFMLMLDPQAALAECRRVLKDGGRLAFSVWGRPEQNPWVTVSGMTMMQLGHMPGGDPFGPGGMFSMSDEGTIRSMVTDAGFEVLAVEEMPVVWTFESFDQDWEFTTQVAGAIAALVEELPDDEVERFRAALEENMAPFRTDSGLSMPGVTINVAAG